MVASPDKHYQARILERRDLSNDLWIVRIDPGGPFEFRAGQYATLGVDHDGKRIERAYSIVSSPYEESLEFFVELVPQGDRKSTRLNSSHRCISYAVFCLKKKKRIITIEVVDYELLYRYLRSM